MLALSMLLVFIAVYAIVLIYFPCKKKIMPLTEGLSPMQLSELKEKGNPIPGQTLIFGGLKLIYGEDLEEHKYLDKINIYTICGRRIRPWLLVVFFQVFIFICSCSVVAFWCEFLINERSQCDSRMDCFARENFGDHDLVQEHPLNEKCHLYENINYTIRCFEFQFDYANAIGNTGGVFLVASVAMKAQAGLWVGAISHKGKVSRQLALAGAAILNLVIEACLIAMPIVVKLVPFFHDRLMETDRKAVQFYTYWATFTSAFTISGPILIIFSKRLRKQMTLSGANHTHSGAASEDDLDGLDLSDWHQSRYGAA